MFPSMRVFDRRSRTAVALLRMNRSAVIILAAVALFVLAVILAVLLVPGLSWAAVYEWMTTSGPSPCGCILAE